MAEGLRDALEMTAGMLEAFEREKLALAEALSHRDLGLQQVKRGRYADLDELKNYLDWDAHAPLLCDLRLSVCEQEGVSEERIMVEWADMLAKARAVAMVAEYTAQMRAMEFHGREGARAAEELKEAMVEVQLMMAEVGLEFDPDGRVLRDARGVEMATGDLGRLHGLVLRFSEVDADGEMDCGDEELESLGALCGQLNMQWLLEDKARGQPHVIAPGTPTRN